MADKCIVAMVKPDLTDKVVDAAKAAGATGATIIDAAGTGAREAKTFFGLSLDAIYHAGGFEPRSCCSSSKRIP